jgi:hypothetical protein
MGETRFDRVEYATDLCALLLRDGAFGQPDEAFWSFWADFKFIEEVVAKNVDEHQKRCDLAERLMQRGEALPNWLLEYLIEKARNGPPSKRRGPDNRLRDLAIAMAVGEACRLTKLPRSRNDATDGPSGCSIVSEALKRLGIRLSAKRIARIHREVVEHSLLPE